VQGCPETPRRHRSSLALPLPPTALRAGTPTEGRRRGQAGIDGGASVRALRRIPRRRAKPYRVMVGRTARGAYPCPYQGVRRAMQHIEIVLHERDCLALRRVIDGCAHVPLLTRGMVVSGAYLTLTRCGSTFAL
jgi:hypothetical protein